MPDYSIYVTDEFEKRLGKITKENQIRISQNLKKFIIPALKSEPHFGNNIKKLRGYEPQTYRYRMGPFRIFYCIDETKKIVGLVSISDRKDAYK